MGSFSNLTLANQTVASFTATKSSFTLMAGPIAVNATFLSPVTVCSDVLKHRTIAHLLFGTAKRPCSPVTSVRILLCGHLVDRRRGARCPNLL